MKPERWLYEAVDAREFEVHCEADSAGRFHAGADALSLTVRQKVRVDGVEGMWDSVAVYCTQDPDGTLVVRVVVSNPDWDEPLQIADLRSRPHDPDCLTALGCNLDHVSL